MGYILFNFLFRYEIWSSVLEYIIMKPERKKNISTPIYAIVIKKLPVLEKNPKPLGMGNRWNNNISIAANPIIGFLVSLIFINLYYWASLELSISNVLTLSFPNKFSKFENSPSKASLLVIIIKI